MKLEQKNKRQILKRRKIISSGPMNPLMQPMNSFPVSTGQVYF